MSDDTPSETDDALPDDLTPDDSGVESFDCAHCEQSFDSKHGLNAHSRVHTSDAEDAEDAAADDAEDDGPMLAPAVRGTVRGYISVDKTRGRVEHLPFGKGLPSEYP